MFLPYNGQPAVQIQPEIALSTSHSAKPLQLAALFVVLLISWLLWSGFYKPLLIGLGIFSCILSLWLAQRTDFFRHAIELKSLLRLPSFWWWLLIEIFKSSIDVAKVVLTPSLPIKPELVEFTSAETSDAGKVILGNSITLSPGTVTIEISDEHLLVHCLTETSAAGLKSGEPSRRAAKLEIR